MPSRGENLLSESQKLVEFDSLNALLNEGTNHYYKQPFIPLSKKNSFSKTRSRNPKKISDKRELVDKKNGRVFEFEDNVLFVDLVGETAVGNSKEEQSNLFSKGRLTRI